MQNNSTYYWQMMENVKGQILDNIRSIMEKLGGKVCFRMYHEYDFIDTRYTFFEVDGDGYDASCSLIRQPLPGTR